MDVLLELDPNSTPCFFQAVQAEWIRNDQCGKDVPPSRRCFWARLLTMMLMIMNMMVVIVIMIMMNMTDDDGHDGPDKMVNEQYI